LTAPNEHRELSADVRHANGVWTVALVDMPEDVGEKRAGQTSLVYGRLLPKGFTRENFAGHPAKPIDAARLAALLDWTRSAMKQTGVPGVGLGIVQGPAMARPEGVPARPVPRALGRGMSLLLPIAWGACAAPPQTREVISTRWKYP
jgi:hypothetical protein